jgi:predicted GIY-YIG superfamily endonuclease
MAEEGSISAKGASGTQYNFDVYRWGTSLRPIGGVYLVLKKQPNSTYTILYVGQTGDLSGRFDNHHRAACFTNHGRTHLAVRAEGSEQRRFAIETDLIRNYQTSCNKQ